MFHEADYEKDFEAPGKVSVWLARFDSEKELAAYMEEKRTEEGDTWSDFYTEFRMGYLDHDFVDFVIHASPVNSLEELVRPVSCSASVAENIRKAGLSIDPAKYNTIICAYDFAFVPDEDYKRINAHVDFIGYVDYDEHSTAQA